MRFLRERRKAYTINLITTFIKSLDEVTASAAALRSSVLPLKCASAGKGTDPDTRRGDRSSVG